MLTLASLALVLTLALAGGAYAVSRFDGLGHRALLVVVVASLAVGGVTAQAMPAGTDSPTRAAGGESVTVTGESEPARLPAATSAQTTGPGETTTSNATATVVNIGDGGRLTYRTADGARRTVGLAGVDLPSVGGAAPSRFDGVLTGSRGRACLAREGRRALVDTRTRLVGESVTVRSTETGAVVGVDGRSLNRQLVRQGYARSTAARYADAEDAARSAHVGVWSCAVVRSTPPLQETNEPGLRITAVHPNPPGDDEASLTEEYVVVKNAGESTTDLSNWYLIEGDGRMYFFSANRTLRPGEELVVRVGSGRDTGSEVFWGANAPVLDNDHETLKLVDGDSEQTVRFSY